MPSTKTADSVHGKAVWAAVCADSGMLAGPECPQTELLVPAAGKHTLTVVDGEGNTASIRFTVAE